MTANPRNVDPYGSLQATRRALAGMAPLVRLGLLAAGLSLFLGHAAPLVSDMQLTWGERIVAATIAVVDLGGFGLAAWVAGRLFRASAELIDVLVDQAEAAARTADLIEWHVAPALERMAVGLDRSLAAPRSDDDPKARALAGARQAIESERWDQAERLVAAFARDFPESPQARDLADEMAETKRAIVADLQARLDAARSANDPEHVIEYRDALTQHLRGEPLKELDRRLIKWLMGLIQKRLRTGTVKGDVAILAARVAESFGDSPEGASLRASLPTLRRSAGLCPRCALPYTGIDDACPQCLNKVPLPAAASLPSEDPPVQVAP